MLCVLFISAPVPEGTPPPGISSEHSPTTFLGFRPSLPTEGSLKQGACLTLTIFCRGSYKPCQMVQIRENQSPKTVRSLKGLLVCGHTLSFPLSLSSSYLLCTRHSLVPACVKPRAHGHLQVITCPPGMPPCGFLDHL